MSVLTDINAFYYYTGNSIYLSHPLAYQFFRRYLGWAHIFNRKLKKRPLNSLRPVIPDNAWRLRITAAAGTKLAAPYSQSTIKVFPLEKSFTPRRASSLTRRRSIRLSPIVKDSRLQPPVGVWAVSQSQWGGPCSHTRYPSLPWWAITSPTSW